MCPQVFTVILPMLANVAYTINDWIQRNIGLLKTDRTTRGSRSSW